VRPAAALTGWRTVVQRQADAWFLHASSDAGSLRPAGGGTFGSNTDVVIGPTGIAANAWTHLALTYDGATLRLYVNGTQAASRAESSALQSVANPLWIGGNSPYGEYFQGLIDEVRVYNRALAVSEIQADMNAPVVAPPSGSVSLASVSAARTVAPVGSTPTSSSTSGGVGVTDSVLKRTRPGVRGILE
jgi:concanavalin A-like lectin/glucanase superfamily protein